MADSSCGGANRTALEYMGQSCNVYPYEDGYDVVKDVLIATYTNLILGENGGNFILIGHKMLFFGIQMDCSLLNQNQILTTFTMRWMGTR